MDLLERAHAQRDSTLLQLKVDPEWTTFVPLLAFRTCFVA